MQEDIDLKTLFPNAKVVRLSKRDSLHNRLIELAGLENKPYRQAKLKQNILKRFNLTEDKLEKEIEYVQTRILKRGRRMQQ